MEPSKPDPEEKENSFNTETSRGRDIDYKNEALVDFYLDGEDDEEPIDNSQD